MFGSNIYISQERKIENISQTTLVSKPSNTSNNLAKKQLCGGEVRNVGMVYPLVHYITITNKRSKDPPNKRYFCLPRPSIELQLPFQSH